jgi:hypothetical protein
MKEIIIWQEKIQAYETDVDHFNPKDSDPLVLMFKDTLAPFTHQMLILIRNQQERIAEEIHSLLDE